MDEQQREEMRELAKNLAAVREDLGYLGNSLRNAAVASLPFVKRAGDLFLDAARKSVEGFEALTDEERKQLTPSMLKVFESMQRAVHASDEAAKKRLGSK